MNDFNRTEWNALLNRAQAALRAHRYCRCHEGTARELRRCPLADTSRPDPHAEPRCRQVFRDTQRNLSLLARSAPERERPALRRTVAALELAYRGLEQDGDP